MKSLTSTVYSWLHQPSLHCTRWAAILLLSTTAGVLSQTNPAAAAERIRVTFGPLAEVIPVADLEKFVADGTLPPVLRVYGRWIDAEPEVIREALKKEYNANLLTLDRTLNNLLGAYLLREIGSAIHTPTRQANVQALRAALVLPTVDDNKISLLEFMQKYPTREMVVDGVVLLRTAQRINRLQGKVENVKQSFRGVLESVQDWLTLLTCN